MPFEDPRVRILSNYLADLLMLNIDSLRYPPSLLSSSIVFLCALTLKATLPVSSHSQVDSIDICRQIFNWHSLEAFEKCVAFVRSAWTETKNNPYMAKYEAVRHKYEQNKEIDVVSTMPSSVPQRAYEEWFYVSDDMEL